MTWRAMDDAPKNGTRVLLYWPYWCSHAVVGYWSNWKNGWVSDVALASDEEPPEAWMPLPIRPPTPPQRADEEGR